MAHDDDLELDELQNEIDLLEEENRKLRDENRKAKARLEAVQVRLDASGGSSGPASSGDPMDYAHGWRVAQRVGIFVDVQNLYYTAKFVHDSKLSYRKLIEAVARGRRMIRAIAYVVEKEGADQQAFYDVLRYAGFEIRPRVVIEREDGSRKSSWNVGIAIDCLTLADRLDAVVLVTGDGDLAPLVEALVGRGVRVEVACFQESTAERLRTAAHEFVPLDRSHLI